MASPIDQEAIISSLDQTVNNLYRAAETGRNAAPNIDRVFMIACGSGYHAMKGIQYWADQIAINTDVRAFISSDFTAMKPPKLNERTLVLLASKSGKTPETLEASDYVRAKSFKTIVFTQSDASPLATQGDVVFSSGDTTETFLANFMLMQTVVAAVLAQKEEWPYLPKLLSSFRALPNAFAAAALKNEHRATQDAALYKDDHQIYFVAAGPEETTAFVFGTCILTEMLNIHAPPVKASEFFHGTLEIVTPQIPLVLILGTDCSRPLMERVKDFCETHGNRLMIYDANDYSMDGIDPEIQPMVAPYLIQSALKRFSLHLSRSKGRALTDRNYMGKHSY
ncbi:Sugar isomerase [Agrobacterium tumefaciens str. Kerr 14]|uniref:Sugar isomerase n=2 Tax=Agrobacterium tumefaciens TaxID=358 RepID=A0A1S7SAP2_AGRTU|nr:Sugar isomerase [Agrobacterium tumefaciens str. Kerr 14]